MKKKKVYLCPEFGLVNCTILTYWENRTKSSALEQNGSRIKRFLKPERSDVSNALRNLFKQQRSDNVPVSAPVLTMSFVLPKF